ncbi:MAG: hypothetical protein V3S84_04840, partial [Dehalococcoidales bacterium]
MNISHSLIPLLACCSFVVLIVLVVRQNWHSRVNQLFIWYVFCLAAWAFGSFMAYADLTMTTYFWNSFLVVPPIFAFVALYHFVCVYLNKPVSRLMVSIGYGACFLFAIAAALGWAIKDAYIGSDGTYYLELGWATYAIMPIMPFFVGAAIFNLVQAYRGEKDPYARNRIAYPLAGISVTLLLSLSNFLPGWKYYPVDQLGNLTNAAVLSYAILRFRLLDINVVLRGGLRYAIQSMIIAGVLLLVGAAYFAARDTIDSINWGLAVGVAILLAIIFQLLIRWMRRPVGGMFGGAHDTYRQMLRGTSGALSSMPELEDQAIWLMDNLMGTVGAQKGG